MQRFEFLARFSRNRGALVGACLILVVALMAVFASVFFPTDPLRIVGLPELWPGEDPEFPAGPRQDPRNGVVMAGVAVENDGDLFVFGHKALLI